MTLVDLVLKPEVVTAAWTYFRDVQTKTQKYEPLLRPEDTPPLELNREIMAKYRDKMKPLYFDPTKYKTYLEQLGIKYPVIKK
jgi:aminobenzoyl-glutamate utilization protein B